MIILKFFKNIFIIFLIFLLLPIYSFADDYNEENIGFPNTIEVNSNISSLQLSSKYAIVLERSSETVLFEKNSYDKTPMASTTKIMTAIIAIENAELTDSVKISKKAANTPGSRLGIYSNTEMTLENLLYGLLLSSGNDCAVAIAEHIGKNEEEFARIMNKKAKLLGLKNTNFVTPHGLDDPNHYTTTYDLAILTNYALKNSIFLKIVGTKNFEVNINGYTKSISNTNELLGYLDGIYGVKTGFTGDARKMLSFSM